MNITDVTHKIDTIDKIPKFVYQPILNFECLIFKVECFIA